VNRATPTTKIAFESVAREELERARTDDRPGEDHDGCAGEGQDLAEPAAT